MNDSTTDIESRRLAKQALLDEQKSLAARNRWGQFATPPLLALDIAEYARDLWEKESASDAVSFLDPAIGTGAFYSAFLRAFNQPVHSGMGVELDSLFASAAGSLWASHPIEIHQSDFTHLAPGEKFNLVLTNPPYVRHHHLPSDEKDRLRSLVSARLGLSVSGLAGLYCYFLLLTDGWLAPDALSIWLIPSEFMAVNYGVAVKEYLLRSVSLVHIHRFSPEDVQFSDALVSSAIVVFRKRRPTGSAKVRFSFGGPITRPNQIEDLPVGDLDVKGRWTRFAERPATMNSSHPRLGELFSIKRGLATGDNSFFILERERAKKLGIPDEHLRPILPSPRFLDADVIHADRDGYPRLLKQLCLIDCSLSEETIRDCHPAFFDYLQKGKESGVANGYLASRRVPWYSQEQRSPAPFLCTYGPSQ